MLELATFITICIAAVLFLLRFLFALESESRAARKRAAAELEPLSAYRTSQVSNSAPVLTMIHYNPSRQAVAARLGFTGESVSDERFSQYKGA